MYNPHPQSAASAPADPRALAHAQAQARAQAQASAQARAHVQAQATQVAALASVFRTARQQLDRDPLLASSATRDLVSRAHQSLPLLCNLVFSLATPFNSPPSVDTGISNDRELLDLLLPHGPLIQVLVLLANDRSSYVYDMNPAMLPEPSLAKLRSGQVADLPDVYAGRVTSSSSSSASAATAPGLASGPIAIRFNMLEFFLFHFAHAPLRMAQLEQTNQSQTRQGQGQGQGPGTTYSQQHQQHAPSNTSGRRLSGVWESASSVFAAGAGAASGMAGQRRQPQVAARHPLGSHTGLISMDEKAPPTLYTILLQSYLAFFVPTNVSSSSATPTIFTPSSSASTSSSAPSAWSLPTPMQPHTRPTLRSPTRQASASGAGGTWWASDRLECSKFFVGCLVECWLGQEPYGPARQEQIKILGKDVLNALYYVVDHISVEALLDVLKAGVPAQVLGLSRWAEAETGEVGLGRIALRAAYHHIAPPLYRFLYSALSHHPLIDSDHGCYAMRQVLSIWIRWITPLAATSPSFSDADLHLVDAFVLSNFAFYTTLMHTYLLRALDLLPLARPQANTRKPGAGYADDMQGIAQVLMVYAAAGQDKQSGPTVYHASVIQLEHVMLGGANGSGSGSGDARAASMASTRATVESHMAWLEGAPASSAGVARVRSRWRPVLVDVDFATGAGTMPSGPLASADTPAAAAVGVGVIRHVLAEAVLGVHTRKAILKPYKDASASTNDVATAATGASSNSPRSASFAFRMLDFAAQSAGVRAFASASHVLRPVGMSDAAIAREHQVMDLIVQVAATVAGVSQDEIKDMHARAEIEVHEFVMQGMAATSAGGPASTSPTSSALARGTSLNQLHGTPVSPTASAAASAWGLPGPLAAIVHYLFGSGTPARAAHTTGGPPATTSSVSRKVHAMDLTPDRLELSATGRMQLMTGARLCPPVPSMRGHALPRDLYTTREVPMLVDLAFGIEDAAKAVLGKVYGWSVRGQREVDEDVARALDANEWIKARARKAGYLVSGIGARGTHALVDRVGLRNFADRALVAWILLLRWAWVLLRLRARCHYASYFVYPVLMWFVVQYPFALEPTPADSLPVNVAVALLFMVMLFGSDYGWNPAHFLVALCAITAVGVVAWTVVRKWVKAVGSDEMAFLGGSRDASPAHVNKSGPGPQEQEQQQQQPMRQVPRTPPRQEGKARAGGLRPVSPLAGMKIGQYGSVRS